jgi:ribosomal protein S18 acetylase RimI-like enzyme
LISTTFQNDLILVAEIDGEVVGLVGLDAAGREFMEPSFRDIWKLYGWRTFRVILYGSLLGTDFKEEELLIGAIAVDELHRGKGVGNRLLDAVVEYASSNGYAAVKLSVIDTNPGARRLYERYGFIETKVVGLPFPISRIFPFKSAAEMVFNLEE